MPIMVAEACRKKGPAVLVFYHNDDCVPGIPALGAWSLVHVTHWVKLKLKPTRFCFFFFGIW